MAPPDQVSNSEDSEVDLIHTPSNQDESRELSQPQSVLSHRFRESPSKQSNRCTQESTSTQEDTIAVMVPAVMVSGPLRPWEYQPFQGATTVDSVLEELEGPGGKRFYKIEYEDGRKEDVSFHKLLKLRNGQNALDFFNGNEDEVRSSSMENSEEELGISTAGAKRIRTKPKNYGFVDTSTAKLDFEDEDMSDDQSIIKKRRLGKGRVSLLTNSSRQSSISSSRKTSRAKSRSLLRDGDDFSSDSDDDPPRRRGIQPTRGYPTTRSSGRVTRSAYTQPTIKLRHERSRAIESDDDIDELAGEGGIDSENSDIVYVDPKSKRKPTKVHRGRSESKGKRGRPRKIESSSPSPERQPTRRSGRERAVKSMRERDMDEEIYADDVEENHAPKVISIREVFQPVEKQSRFRLFHSKDCDVCGGTGSNSNKGISPLIYCQGCSTAIHKVCLGYRSGRDHMVTKVGPENFIMQCRRCIGIASKKDHSAPRLDICQGCKEPGQACAAFSRRKTSKQEEKLREENGGDDPITEVSKDLVNNSDNVLFRCKSCQRAYHFQHLPALSETTDASNDEEELHDERFQEYTPKWQCKDCCDMPAKVQGLVAWRPLGRESYVEGETVEEFREDEKEYLIKWEDMSYFKCTWMPGGWVWGVTPVIMRKAFFRRDEGANLLPKWTWEDAVPEEFLRIEIIFDVSYDNAFRPRSEAFDKDHVSEVDQVLVKFQGLGYDEAVWEDPPSSDDSERWSDFVAAYNEYVVGKYFKQPPAAVMKERLENFRSLKFAKKVELDEQPSAMTGGQMMPYQMDGLNWLLYNFHQKKNVILADEMGLGKTIQIIALIASLVKDKPKCSPFLIVTPNSTCPNWRREIKKWAPSLRVVAYYGAKQARDMAMEYELYPDRCSDFRAHVVITSYEAPVDDHSRSVFKRIKWSGLIVDEGQRLKNDENLLYGALKALKVPFQVLLTGTPLQNNKRELFNLLQFLDTSINAAKLDEEYAEVTKENLPKLHELIRPFFLRRTKLQVLKFLPPMAQVILPVTMSVVQKKLYKSILSKNSDLIKSIFGQRKTVRQAERGNLNNILMQLRKCLCHPFLYSSAIEETSINEIALHRNLVDASSKFQLLEIMLPKLRERGHRVLLFSQFLNQLDLVEDFLNGLGLLFQRLDGTIGSLEKQKRIDAFNASDSPLFAFLLSTRAGGVGINLATADTVIIMDPDFNPHQDIQALSRAHRIGQKKKVLVFQLMTKDSAEEKMIQIGRKKMALDQALIESMDAEDDAGIDLESILKHGATALFNDDDRNDIHYDSASVDKLLDRTQVENTNTDEGKTAESQFSFARVWANNKGDLSDDVGDADLEPNAPNISVWENILKQREIEAAREAKRNMQTFGRGKRARQTVDYKRASPDLDDDMVNSSPLKQPNRRRGEESASDLDFAAAGESDGDDSEVEIQETVNPSELHEGLKVGSSPAAKKGTNLKRPVQSRRTPQKKTPHKPVSSGPKQKGAISKNGIPSQTSKPKQTGSSAKIQQQAVKKTSIPAKSVPAIKPAPVKSGAKTQESKGAKPAVAAKAAITAQKSNLAPAPQTPRTHVEKPVVSGKSSQVPPNSATPDKSLKDQSSAALPSSELSKIPHTPPQKPKNGKQIIQHKANANPQKSTSFVTKAETTLRSSPADTESITKPPTSLQSSPAAIESSKSAQLNTIPNISNTTTATAKLAPSQDSSVQITSKIENMLKEDLRKPGNQSNMATSYSQVTGLQLDNNKMEPISGQSRSRAVEDPTETTPPQKKRKLAGRVRLTITPKQCSDSAPSVSPSTNIAHFGVSGSCPNLASEVQIRLMLDALKKSTEPKEQIEAARTLLRDELAERVRRKKNRGGR